MSQETGIQWTAWRNHEGVWLPGATWNIWRGCTEVHTGCVECYARDLIETRLAHLHRAIFKRCGIKDWDTCPLWGDKAPRVRGSRVIRLIPLHLQKDYEKSTTAGKRPMDNPRVFLGSLMDLFDDCPAGVCDPETNTVIDALECMEEALQYIRLCPDVTFICVTKRPEAALERIKKIMANNIVGPEFDDWLYRWIHKNEPPKNIWFISSISDQPTANRIVPHVLQFPAVVRGLSVEPLVGPVDLNLGSYYEAPEVREERRRNNIDWIIIGGESGHSARPCDVDWIRSLVKQGKKSGVATFVKQLGANVVDVYTPSDSSELERVTKNLRDKKGGDISEWPEELRVREFPKAKSLTTDSTD